MKLDLSCQPDKKRNVPFEAEPRPIAGEIARMPAAGRIGVCELRESANKLDADHGVRGWLELTHQRLVGNPQVRQHVRKGSAPDRPMKQVRKPALELHGCPGIRQEVTPEASQVVHVHGATVFEGVYGPAVEDFGRCTGLIERDVTVRPWLVQAPSVAEPTQLGAPVGSAQNVGGSQVL